MLNDNNINVNFNTLSYQQLIKYDKQMNNIARGNVNNQFS